MKDYTVDAFLKKEEYQRQYYQKNKEKIKKKYRKNYKKNIEKKRIKAKKYYKNNKVKILKRMSIHDKKQYHEFKEKGLCTRCGKKSKKTLCKKCYEKFSKSRLYSIQEAKRKVFEYYGNNCACLKCPEKNPKFLTLDHINNDGAHQRKKLKMKFNYYAILKRKPKDLQLLCMNCNCGKQWNSGRCPHMLEEKCPN